MQAFGRRGGGKRLARRLFCVLQATPVTIPTAVATFSLVAVFHLLINNFDAVQVMVVGGIGAALTGYAAHRLYHLRTADSDPERRVFDALVLAGILLWCVGNLAFTSEHLFTNRDPATYNLAGHWLIDHQDLQIDKPDALDVLQAPGIHAQSLGFATSPADEDQLEAQGAHVLPTWQALAGKLFGAEGVLRLNVIFGATALLAFYGLARLLIRPRWAAIGTLIMSLSLPLIFATRDSYTEPLTMTFVFAGLALLLYAQQAKQPRHWGLAGLVLGSAALARIDAYILFAGIQLAAIVMLLVAQRKEQISLGKCIAWLALGMALGGYLAWLDVTLLSTAYYHAHQHFIVPELILLAALTIVGMVLVITNWRWQWLPRLDRLTNRWRTSAIWIAVIGFFAVLASRPIWLVGYDTRGDVVLRSFAEQTLNWLWWYLGPITVAAGIAGLAWGIVRLLKGKNQLWLPFLSAFTVMCLLYLVRPSITGDQVWATRRLLPIVIPGFVLLAMWVYESLYDQKVWRWRGRTLNLQIVITILATISVLSPLFITYPFTLRRLYVPELTQVRAICESAPDDATVIWAGESADFATQPTRTLCGNDALGLTLASAKAADNQTVLKEIAAQAQAAHLQVVIGFYEEQSSMVPLGTNKQEMLISQATYHEIEHSYKRPPRNMITLERTIYMGQLAPDGTITPLSRPQ